MRLPEPVPGLVIAYSYLWRQEQAQGHEEGRKDRPCLVVVSVIMDGGVRRVLVLPVTHTPPGSPELAIELPAKVKQRLGMDDARSWIVISEWNEFTWPGPDLRRVRGKDTIVYGMLPPSLFRTIRERLLVAARHPGGVART